jgi:transposase
MLYLEIQQMKERGFSIQQIAKQLKVSRTTVYNYMEKTPEEAFEWVNSLGSRKKKLDPYKDWIVAWLQKYPHLNASQIQDWLLEKFPDFTVGESTMRLYVNQIREEYQIAKTKVVRQYEAVDPIPNKLDFLDDSSNQILWTKYVINDYEIDSDNKQVIFDVGSEEYGMHSNDLKITMCQEDGKWKIFSISE